MDNKISIIIPAYNCELYIKRCMNSIIAQTYKNIEIIAVDDGSTDSTPKILDEYANTDKRIIVIHKKNEGVTAAREDGILAATGEYLCFCDSDDSYEPDMCSVLIATLKKYNVKVAVCGYTRIENGIKTPVTGSEKEYILNRDEAIKSLLAGGYFTGSLWTKIYEKSLFDNLKIKKSLKYNEDVLINYYIFKKIDSLAFVDKCMYNYFIRSDSSTGGADSIKANLDFVYVSDILFNDLKGTSNQIYVERRYVNNLINLYRAYTVDKKYKNERNEVVKRLCTCLNEFSKLPRNLRINIFLIRYFSFFYPIIYKMYDKVRTKKLDV